LSPASVTVLMLAGQVITGGSTSPMNTTKEHCAVLPDVSVAVHVTVVDPALNTLPDWAEHVVD
jgi:hypothetical protein